MASVEHSIHNNSPSDRDGGRERERAMEGKREIEGDGERGEKINPRCLFCLFLL